MRDEMGEPIHDGYHALVKTILEAAWKQGLALRNEIEAEQLADEIVERFILEWQPHA